MCFQECQQVNLKTKSHIYVGKIGESSIINGNELDEWNQTSLLVLKHMNNNILKYTHVRSHNKYLWTISAEILEYEPIGTIV